MAMVRELGLVWIVSSGLVLAACAKSPADTAPESGDGSSGGGGSTAEPTTSPDPDSGTAGSTPGPGSDSNSNSNSGTTGAPDPSGTTADGESFLVPPDGGVSGQCSPTSQDCPRGEKCTAVSDTPGEPWAINTCVPVMGEGQPGDPCDIADGKYTGLDNCGVGAICLLTDDEGKGGACVEFCDENMACPITGEKCVVYNDGALPICLGNCDPLLQDCPEGQACYNSGGSDFVCFKESAMPGEGLPGDECTYVNQCQKGSFCANAASLADCSADTGCCTPYCPISGGNGPCNPGEECVGFFAEGEAPPGYEDVGVCALPG
jgi:hypothetical protein